MRKLSRQMRRAIKKRKKADAKRLARAALCIAISLPVLLPTTKPVFRSSLPAHVLELKPKKKGLNTLVEPFLFTIDGKDHWIPEGFITDFSSTPLLAQLIVGRDSAKNMGPGLVHDYLYETGIFSQEICDRIYYTLLLKCGTPEWKAKLAYNALRKHGHKAYGRYRVASASRLEATI